MRLGIDLDGCVYDFVDDFTKWIHLSTGRPLAELTYPETWNFYKDQWGMTTAEYLDAMQRGVTAGCIFMDGRSYFGAASTMRHLMRKGHELHIVTHRAQEGAEAATRFWLRQNGVPFTSLTFSADKTVVPVDVFIEDNVDNYDALEAVGHNPVLMSHPWNEQRQDCRRVKNWFEFREHVAALEAVAA